MRMHIGTRRAPALAVFLCHLIGAETFVIIGVEVLAEAELRFLRGLQENVLPAQGEPALTSTSRLFINNQPFDYDYVHLL